MDNQFNLYLKIEDKESGNDYWIAFLLSGKRWIFKNKGLPYALTDLMGNTLRFHWEEGVLKELYGLKFKVKDKEVNKKWSVKFIYKDEKETYPSHTKQGLFNILKA